MLNSYESLNSLFGELKSPVKPRESSNIIYSNEMVMFVKRLKNTNSFKALETLSEKIDNEISVENYMFDQYLNRTKIHFENIDKLNGYSTEAANYYSFILSTEDTAKPSLGHKIKEVIKKFLNWLRDIGRKIKQFFMTRFKFLGKIREWIKKKLDSLKKKGGSGNGGTDNVSGAASAATVPKEVIEKHATNKEKDTLQKSQAEVQSAMAAKNKAKKEFEEYKKQRDEVLEKHNENALKLLKQLEEEEKERTKKVNEAKIKLDKIENDIKERLKKEKIIVENPEIKAVQEKKEEAKDNIPPGYTRLPDDLTCIVYKSEFLFATERIFKTYLDKIEKCEDNLHSIEELRQQYQYEVKPNGKANFDHVKQALHFKEDLVTLGEIDRRVNNLFVPGKLFEKYIKDFSDKERAAEKKYEDMLDLDDEEIARISNIDIEDKKGLKKFVRNIQREQTIYNSKLTFIKDMFSDYNTLTTTYAKILQKN